MQGERRAPGWQTLEWQSPVVVIKMTCVDEGEERSANVREGAGNEKRSA